MNEDRYTGGEREGWIPPATPSNKSAREKVKKDTTRNAEKNKAQQPTKEGSQQS